MRRAFPRCDVVAHFSHTDLDPRGRDSSSTEVRLLASARSALPQDGLDSDHHDQKESANDGLIR